MQQKIILENWRKFLKEEVDEIAKLQQQTSQEMTSNTATKPQPTEEEKTEATKETIIGSVEHSLLNAVATAKKNGISPSQIKVDLQKSLNDLVKEDKKKKQILSEGIDINTIKKVIETLKKYKLNLDITKILPYANKIIEAVKEIVSLDGNQNTQSLKEAKKPILVPLLNKYGLLVAGIAMAIVTMSGAPPEFPSEYIIKMISMGLQNKTVNDFFGSMNGVTGAEFATDLFAGLMAEEKKKKSGDRCTRIAKRKYDVWPSAYASGAVVKCRQGKIWKGISENMSDQEIDDALLLEEVEIIEEAKKKDYKPNFSKEKEQGLHGWFARNDGKGWVNCRTGGPCGRDSADKGGKYPACRPTKAQCKSAGKGPLRKKKSSSPISWTKKKKKD
jgi:hypothetical protein